jgi:hypothetical protein
MLDSLPNDFLHHLATSRQKASLGGLLRWLFYYLVPTARLELAQLAPLPPQDSVSTNFTTSALALYFNLL